MRVSRSTATMAPGIEFTLSLGHIPLITFTLRQWHFHFNDRLALSSYPVAVPQPPRLPRESPPPNSKRIPSPPAHWNTFRIVSGIQRAPCNCWYRVAKVDASLTKNLANSPWRKLSNTQLPRNSFPFFLSPQLYVSFYFEICHKKELSRDGRGGGGENLCFCF